MSSNKSRDRGAVFEIVVLKDKKKDATSTPEQSSHYQSLTLNKKAAQKECSGYMTPTPRQKEVNKTTEEDEKFADSEIQSVDKQQNRSGERNSLSSKCIILLGVAIIVTLVASLSFAGYNNSQMEREKLESFKQLQIRDDMITELYEHIDNLTESLQQMEVKMDTHASTAITRLQNLESSFQQLQVRVGTLRDNISSTPPAIASLSSRLDGFNEQLNTAFSAFSANDTRISAQLNAISSQLNTTSTSLTNVSGKVNAGVNLYRGCHMDSVSCRVIQHPSNEHWYLCSTPFLVLNATVSCVHE